MGFRLWQARTFAVFAARNTFARALPRVSFALQRMTKDTGRGGRGDAAADADYFEAVLSDYRAIAEASSVGPLFDGKHVLELGPGDTRAIALLSRLEGATWEGYDSFDIQSRDAHYTNAIYAELLARRSEKRAAPALLDGCRMHTSPRTLHRGGRRFDVVLSRAVLEHVRDLDALMSLVADVTTPAAVLIHKIDLRSHGIEHDHPLDFLRFSESAWKAMSSHIDLPNRARLPTYVTLAERAGLHTSWIAPTHTMSDAAAAHLPAPFAEVDEETLRTLGLWLVQVGPEHPLASRPLVRATTPPLSRY